MVIFRAIGDIIESEEILFNYDGTGDLQDFREQLPFIH